MRIIGCDLHARQQTLAMLDTATGEVVEVTLQHEGDNVREFYSSLPGPVSRGYRSHGIDAVVFKSPGRTGNRVPGRSFPTVLLFSPETSAARKSTPSTWTSLNGILCSEARSAQSVGR